MPRPNDDLVGLLEELLMEAKMGELQAMFVVMRYGRDCYTHDLITDNRDDLILQVRTEIIVAQIELDKDSIH